VKLMHKKHMLLCLLWLGSLFSPWQAFSQDSLSSVLAEAGKQEIVVLKYHEIKHIVFLQDAVSTSGVMFLAGDTFILEQLQPERLLISMDKQRLRFFIPKKHIYHSKMLSSPSLQRLLNLFKPLMEGNEKALKDMFDTIFIVDKAGWRLDLKPKDMKGVSFKHIQIIGKPAQAAQQAMIEMVDGSTSEWQFSMQETSDKTIKHIQTLLLESKGL